MVGHNAAGGQLRLGKATFCEQPKVEKPTAKYAQIGRHPRVGLPFQDEPLKTWSLISRVVSTCNGATASILDGLDKILTIVRQVVNPFDMLYPVPSLPTSGVLRATELLRLLGARSLRQALGEFRTSTWGCSVRDDIVDAAKTMVKLEESFVKLAFGLGKIEGMLPEHIHAYVADWRLAQLRIAPVFGFFEAKEGGFTQLKAHPLPWLGEILNGVEHANFFEQRATEYSKAATRPQPLVG
ncbi:hypothetical protein [Bradyrhizobium zhanjiangense]|uniref:hypothetical protein n=1 Tax=Bradyrhizobium zhanjiangense TaxID=1325107 RepID=UPI001FDFC646|nr:hypothetical protein [Bradyrhizobium zhanjiangense]